MAKVGAKKKSAQDDPRITGRGTDQSVVRSKEDKENGDLVAQIRRHKCLAFEADRENREEAIADIKFLHVPGAQYDNAQRTARGERPCYEFNELRVKALRVINDMRANRPQGKIRATEDGDKNTADTREGLCRNIWSVSKGDSVTDYAADFQVSGGMGAWRVETKWNDDSVWDQDIGVKAFANPFCLWGDPSAKDPLKLDARFWIVSERIAKTAYDGRWPEKQMVSFDDETEFDDEDTDWYEDGDDGLVRIVEYWYKVPTKKTIALLSDGKTVEISESKAGDTRTATLADGSPLPVDPNTGQPLQIKQRRVVKTDKIMSCICSGSAMLEPPTEWPGKFFPFVQVYGEWRVIEGKVTWHGITRFSKDSQRLANVTMTAIAESVMSSPMSHYWATPKQAEGHLNAWKQAHKELIPFLPYNGDPAANGPPQRMQSADVPVALMEMRGIASDLLKGTSGIFDASVGQQSNETSGRAINARARQGKIATFNFSDNMAKAVCFTWQIIDDLVGKIYKAERSMRTLGVDGAEKYVKVNSVQPDPKNPGQLIKLNDLSAGKFDVTYTVGPSFSTQRQEATEMYTQLGQTVPQVWAIAGDLIMKSMDLPYADQIAERMRTLLPPAIQKQLADGKEIPPEAQAAMAQAEMMMQAVQTQAGELQKTMADAQNAQTSAKQATADLKVQQANLKAEESRLAADVARFQAATAEQALLASQQGVNEEFRQLQGDALASIQEQATTLFTKYAEQLQATHAAAVASVASTPRKRGVKLSRQGDGSYVGEIQDQPDMAQAA